MFTLLTTERECRFNNQGFDRARPLGAEVLALRCQKGNQPLPKPRRVHQTASERPGNGSRFGGNAGGRECKLAYLIKILLTVLFQMPGNIFDMFTEPFGMAWRAGAGRCDVDGNGVLNPFERRMLADIDCHRMSAAEK